MAAEPAKKTLTTFMEQKNAFDSLICGLRAVIVQGLREK